jgi:hypothetical protein
MSNSLNPAAYVISAKVQASYYQYRCVESFENTSALNRKQTNGRINADRVFGEYYTAVSVSPFHPSFYTQIEKGISGIVYALLDKNYFTVSSCEGHGDSMPYVKIALADKSDIDSITPLLINIPYVTFKISDTSANTEVFLENGISKVRPLDPSKFSKSGETDGINKLFFRKHTSYCFLDIMFYADTPAWWNIIHQLKIKYHRAFYSKHIKQQMVDIIKSESFPVYNK